MDSNVLLQHSLHSFHAVLLQLKTNLKNPITTKKNNSGYTESILDSRVLTVLMTKLKNGKADPLCLTIICVEYGRGHTSFQISATGLVLV